VPRAPAVTSLAEVVNAVSTEVPRFFALRATSANGGGQRVRGGAASWVWMIGGASAPCSVTMDVCIKLLEVVDDASTCKASTDEVGDEELFGVPDDI